MNYVRNKEAWKRVIPADDLDRHMLNIGQAEANAKILEKMLIDFPLEPNAKVLVPGCGTGQMFDFLHPHLIKNVYLTFTDINKEYLSKLKQRLERFPEIKYNLREDDIESTRIRNNFNSCLVVLLLEHVNWRKALINISRLKITSIYIIVQHQNKNRPVTTTYKNIPLSIVKFSEAARPNLILKEELSCYLLKEGFNLKKGYQEEVAHNKKMVGLFFSKNGRAH